MVASAALVSCATPKKLDIVRENPAAKGAATPLLAAMKSEIMRSVMELKSEDAPAPYFIGCEVIDLEQVDVRAEFGALTKSEENHARMLDVDLRVGDPKLDNTHPLGGRDSSTRRRGGRGTIVPIDDDPVALRTKLWLAIDQRYKNAVEQYTKVRAAQGINVKDDDPSDDFSKEKAVEFIDVPAKLQIDRASWESRVKELSAMFRNRDGIHTSQVALQIKAETRYFVSSEGTVVQAPRTYARVSFWGATKTDDGMPLHRQDAVDVATLKEMPPQSVLRSRVQAVIEDVLALRRAPIADPFTGPAILDGRAAAVFFHETFGHRVEGQRQKNDEEGQTFAKKIGEAVMPPFIDVFDDPTIRTLNGIELNGHYLVDDEGVAARQASLVEKGVLKGFLMSRSPTRGFNNSNGHGRRAEGNAVVARQGNLVVDPLKVKTPEALKKMLLAEAKRQEKPYGLRFRDVEGGYTTTSRSGTQSFKVVPIVVYRVYPDGREELVRGANLEGTPLASLSKILAAANDFAVFNGYCGAESGSVPVSAASPSLLVGQVEIAHKVKERDKPPILPPPSGDAATEGSAP